MEIRHLRCFSVLAEELHFARAAARLHIEQSPLSRTIKELEDNLGVRLFDRNRRGTRLTRAGNIFLEDVHRIFTLLEQAQERAKTAALGYYDTLRIAVSDGTEPHLPALLARCRAEEPEVGVRLTAVPLAEQLRGLRENTFDAGLARSDNVGDGIVAEPAWSDSLKVIMPNRHPLLVHQQVPLQELAHYPLVTYHPKMHEGYSNQLARVLGTLEKEPLIADRATSLDMMLTLVAAGYGVGFATTAQVAICCHPGITVRPISGDTVLTTYFLRPNGRISETLGRFIARLQTMSDELAFSFPHST
jgi:DNA-binding transcriptional LysR family regulator